MDKYLLELLKEVNTIIIPGLGALTITNADSGEIMFMSYLKHDDGKLSGYIAEKEGMDENEAKNLIAKYVREIITKLDQGESYDMFQFGSFFKNDGGEIDFKNWDGIAESTVVEEVKEEPVIIKNDEPKQEKEFVAESEKEEKAKSVSNQEPLNEEEIEPEDDIDSTSQDEEKPVIIAEANTIKELNIEQREELEKNVQKLEKLRADKDSSKHKKKRSPAFWMLMVLTIIICAGGAYVVIDYDNFKQHVPFLADKEKPQEGQSEIDKMKDMMGLNEEGNESADAEESSQEISLEETDKEESSEELSQEPIKEEIINEPKVESKEVKTDASRIVSSGTFHIIAGAFSSADNAERLAESLRQQGYSSKVGLVNGLNMVSVRSFPTREEAESALPDIKSAAPKAWVYNGNL